MVPVRRRHESTPPQAVRAHYHLLALIYGCGLDGGLFLAAALKFVAHLLEGKDERQSHAEHGRGQPLVRGQQRARRVEYVVIGQ